jgi:hypothetical protein
MGLKYKIILNALDIYLTTLLWAASCVPTRLYASIRVGHNAILHLISASYGGACGRNGGWWDRMLFWTSIWASGLCVGFPLQKSTLATTYIYNLPPNGVFVVFSTGMVSRLLGITYTQIWALSDHSFL